MGLSDTQDNALRKVSLTKIYGQRRRSENIIVGWESGAPVKGKPYTIYLSRGRAFRTSRVEEVKEASKGFVIKTMNSLYEVQYV
jgi:hypothetical protein